MGSRYMYSDRTGIVAPDAGWVPPIRYLLRRARILELLRKQPVGRLLEVGCGAGALLCDLTRRGYAAQGLETSEKALQVAARIAEIKGRPPHGSSTPQTDRQEPCNMEGERQ